MSSELENIQGLGVAELAARSGEELATLVRDTDKALAQLQLQKDWLESVVAYKYVFKASQARAQLQQEFGEISFEDEGVRVLVDLPREVSWDQQKLKTIAQRIQEQGEDPSEFLDVHYSVPQKKFDCWPQEVRRSFEPALQVKPGRCTYKLVGGSK
ncbi:hypothetical protein [Endozoicomonas numazuensis]|uniref:Uncharacterized protein n=1 Tax=Endozoicomonas numazuensis TaxID=1137799 RepID=A0A081NI26_9GAMM|nr:hypothetical protein [Endozoicomonas numazuensis]KEQ18099.1 hypothetical protein GZ78_11035 [Endozoicomonas numazuensis]